MAIQNGLQEAHALLLQNSNLKMRAAAIAQGIYNVVVGTSSGALKLFRIALAATGLGLFVILLGTLVANWDKVKKSISENAQAMFDFAKKVTILVPPLNLLIKAGEYLYKNFEKVKTAIFGIDDAIGAFLSTTGTVLGKLTSGDFSGAIASFRSIGSETAKAFYQGQQDEINRQKDLGLANILENNSGLLQKDIKRREALGKDAFDLEKKVAENQINILKLRKASKEEIQEAEFALELLLLERQKQTTDKAANNSKEAQKKREEAEKKALEASLEAVNKNFALQESEARRTIKDADELKLKLEQIETAKQIGIATVKRNYAKDGTSDAIELENQLLELESKYNEFFQRAKADPVDLLPTKLKDDIVNNVEQIKGKLKELETQYNSAFGEESSGLQRIDIIEKIKNIRKEFESEVSKLNSPKLNKLTFETGGFDAIDLDQLLPKDRVPALQNRLGLVTSAVDDLKAKIKAGLGDPLDLKAFDSLQKEGEEIIELMERLGFEIPDAIKKILSGIKKDKKKSLFQDILGLSDEEFEKFQKDIKFAGDLAKDSINQILNSEIEAADQRIDVQKDRVSKAEKIAEKGNVKQLEIEEERLAKLQEKREKYVEAQRILSQIEILSSNAVAAAKSIEAIANGFAAGGPAGIITGIATGLALAAQIAAIVTTVKNSFSDIPAFFEGSELISADPRFRSNKVSNGRDGYVFRGDGTERMVDGTINSKLNGFPNYMLPDAVKYYQMRPKSLPVISQAASTSNQELVQEIKAMRESFENTKTSINLDKNGLVIDVVKMIQKRVDRERYKA